MVNPRVLLPLCALVLAVSGAARQAAPAQTQAQQHPVFRGGTHFVRVDAYPLLDGRIVEGLTPDDFEVLEDGMPQAIESFDFIRFATFTPESERRDPSSQREGFERAADPRYRVFVLFVDMGFGDSIGTFEPFPDVVRIQQPLVNFIDRVIGVNDLFGLLSSRNTVKDLVLAQKTTVTVEQVKDLFRARQVDRDPVERFDPRYNPECLKCRDPRPGEPDQRDCALLRRVLAARYHADQTFTLLHELVATLGAIREERKNVVFVANTLARWREDDSLYDRLQPGLPKMGIDNGRLGLGDPHKTEVTDYACAADVNRLPLMNFERRFDQLLDEARRANVAFYPITPSGLQAPPDLLGVRLVEEANEGLRLLARDTGGVAVVDSNDLNAGMRRIADDLQAYYVLGYYTTNTKFDGGVRKITVRMKGASNPLRAGTVIRARREYRAPTQDEIAALMNRPAAPPDTEPPAVIGDPQAYRVSRTQPPEAVTRLEFVRTDRVRVRWPALAALERREARLLDSAGKALPVDLPVAEQDDGRAVAVELSLAPLGRGVYSIELTAASASRTERRRVTFLVK